MTNLETVNIGTVPNDKTGDPLRNGGEKINNNFIKLDKVRRIVFQGETQIYKGKQNGVDNVSIDNVEPGDVCTGWVSDTVFLKFGVFQSGDPSTIAAYDQNSIEYIDLNDNEI